MRKWERVLYDKDQQTAKEMTKVADDHNKTWGDVGKVFEYNHPLDGDYVYQHFIRVLNEIKLLSIYGDHTWQHFQNKPEIERVY